MRLFTLHLIFITFLLSGCLFGSQEPAPVAKYGTSPGAGSAGIHSVITGDTLWSISQRYNVVMRDVVLANNLRAPFTLAAGQRLKLPPPRTYKVRAGDSLYTVSRLFNVHTSEVAGLNNLKAPYTLRQGQVLKMPSPAAKVQPEPPPPPPVRTAAVTPQEKDPDARTVQPRTKHARVTTAPPKREGKFHSPVEGSVLSSYGPKEGGLHNDGMNIAAPKGAPVGAAENGVVVYAGNELKGSGNLVLVRHEDGWMSAYAHLDKISVARGQTLKRGETLGTVGSTGSVDRPQLHFELRKGTAAVNPAPYLKG